jgi:hypothetical protein
MQSSQEDARFRLVSGSGWIVPNLRSRASFGEGPELLAAVQGLKLFLAGARSRRRVRSFNFTDQLSQLPTSAA